MSRTILAAAVVLPTVACADPSRVTSPGSASVRHAAASGFHHELMIGALLAGRAAGFGPALRARPRSALRSGARLRERRRC